MSDYTSCKLYGHSWRPYDVEVQGYDYLDIITCLTCGTVRKDRIRRTGTFAGDVMGRTYVYPKGYHKDKRRRKELRAARAFR